MDSSNRRVNLNRATFLLASATLSLAFAGQSLAQTQTGTPQSIPQVSPSQSPVPTPTAISTPTAIPFPTPAIVIPTPIPNSTIVPESMHQPDPLDLQMSLGDGRRLWHPTRRRIGMIEAFGSTPTNRRFAVKVQVLNEYLTALAPFVKRPAIKAKVNLTSSTDYSGLSEVHVSIPQPLKVIPGQPGAELDVDGSATAIEKSIVLQPDQTHIILALKMTPPPPIDKVYDTISARLAHYVTHFNPGEVGRTQTVRLAISLVDGTVVQPGQIFSLNGTVGERTAARGFGMGIVFVDGHLDKQLGGGMCQVATTLYNAVLLAHLKVVERHPHARTVPYVEPGQDATVYWGSKDFKFQNDTDSPICISYRTTATHAICDIYGKDVPGLKVRTVDDFQRLGQRHFTSMLRRYSTLDGKTTMDYESYSDYNWTPALDYTF